MNKKVSIIIPNFNGLELLRINLPSVASQSYQDIETIIVDNGSRDDSVNFIKKHYPKVKVIENGKNLGFAKAVNIGIKEAKGDSIFLVNNDTKLGKDCLKYLKEALDSNNELGFASAKSLNFYNPKVIDTTGDILDVVGHLYSRGNGGSADSYKTGGYIFLGSGNGTMFKKSVIEEVGYFDEDFFFYMEDADFCLRLQFLGYKGWYEPKAIIHHMRQGTSGRVHWVGPMVFKNLNQMIIKNYPTALLMKDFNFLKIILVHLNTVRHLIFKGYIWEVMKIEFSLLLELDKILSKRQKIQKNKKVTDNYIIENIAKKTIRVGKLLSW